jgi:hypothetical protein
MDCNQEPAPILVSLEVGLKKQVFRPIRLKKRVVRLVSIISS